MNIEEHDTGKTMECLIWYHWYDMQTEKSDLEYVERDNSTIWFIITQSHSAISVGKRVLSNETIKYYIKKYLEKNNTSKDACLEEMRTSSWYRNGYFDKRVPVLETNLGHYYTAEALRNEQR